MLCRELGAGIVIRVKWFSGSENYWPILLPYLGAFTALRNKQATLICRRFWVIELPRDMVSDLYHKTIALGPVLGTTKLTLCAEERQASIG